MAGGGRGGGEMRGTWPGGGLPPTAYREAPKGAAPPTAHPTRIADPANGTAGAEAASTAAVPH